jgi:hypothetical protein
MREQLGQHCPSRLIGSTSLQRSSADAAQKSWLTHARSTVPITSEKRRPGALRGALGSIKALERAKAHRQSRADFSEEPGSSREDSRDNGACLEAAEHEWPSSLAD